MPQNPAGHFLPMPVARTSVEPDRLYVWHVHGNRHVVVRLSIQGDSLVTLHDEDEWYFTDKLIGSLYGPFIAAS